MNISELRAKALRIAHEAREKITNTENMTPEIEAEIDRMMADGDALEERAAKLEKIEARERAYDQADRRTPAETAVAESRGAPLADEVRAKAFGGYIRGTVTEQELRALGVSSGSVGGNLVPSALSDQLVVSMKAYGPLNEGASSVNYITTQGGNPFSIPTMDDTGNIGSIIAENTAVSNADLTFGQITLGAYKFTTGVCKVSSELLQDAAIDPQAIVTAAMSERMGRILNQKFTVGAGTTEPRGIVTGSGTGITAAGATGITYDDIVNLYHSVDPAYRANVGFMFNDATLKAIRLLKDTNGRPIWSTGVDAAGLVNGAAGAILGCPYFVNQDMASIGSGNVSMLAGDWSKFAVRKVKEFSIRRLDERYADSDQVGFVGFARYDSVVTDSRAIKRLTH